MKHKILAISIGIIAITLFAIIFFSQPLGVADNETTLNEEQAIQIGKTFFENINRPVGKVLLTSLEQKTANNAWQNLGVNISDNQQLQLCWIIRFEQVGLGSGHFIEVWINAYNGDILGGNMCR